MQQNIYNITYDDDKYVKPASQKNAQWLLCYVYCIMMWEFTSK